MKNTIENTPQKKKILIMGLDQAGKTCITKCLQGVKNLSAFDLTKPTMGLNKINFHALGSEFIIFDFGGQEAYRDKYLENFNRHIENTDKIIYVIDIQDKKRYLLAIDYLKKIVDLIPNNQKLSIEFSVFLHKYDSDWELLNDEIIEMNISKLIEQIKETFLRDFNYNIHKTSIYTVFEKTSIL